MGRRRKTRKIRPTRPKRVIPKIFQCPNCGKTSLTVDVEKKKDSDMIHAIIRCGVCKLKYEMDLPSVYQPVDAYAKFLDEYHSGSAQVVFVEESEEAEAQE